MNQKRVTAIGDTFVYISKYAYCGCRKGNCYWRGCDIFKFYTVRQKTVPP